MRLIDTKNGQALIFHMETHCLVLLVLSQGCCGQGKHFFKVREKSWSFFFFYKDREDFNSTSKSLSKHSFPSKSTMAEKKIMPLKFR